MRPLPFVQALFAVQTLFAALVAQAPQTFVVDIANGPGAQFPQIDAAVAAVPDGSILIVRPGSYQGFHIDGKGFTILCDPAVSATWLLISNTLANQPVIVRGLAVNGGARVTDAAALVLLDGAGTAIVSPPGALGILRAPQVCLRDYLIRATGSLFGTDACHVVDSDVVAEGCVFEGGPLTTFGSYPYCHAPGAAIRADRSRVQLSHSSAIGGNGGDGGSVCGLAPGAPAILLSASDLRVIGTAGDRIAGGTNSGGLPQIALLGKGIARIAPAVMIAGTAGPGIAFLRPTMAGLRSFDAPIGGTLTAVWSGAPGNIFVIAIGIRGPTLTLPGVQDPLWLDSQNFAIAASGVGPTSGTFQSQVSVPNLPGFRGVNLLWQAASLSAIAVLELSNPGPTVIR